MARTGRAPALDDDTPRTGAGVSGHATGARALDALLSGLVDYAGLFPPAALTMHDAVARYARHASGPNRGMLGRFIVPVGRLGEFAAAAAEARASWRLSVLADADDGGAIDRFNRDASSHGRWVIDTVESKASERTAIWRLATTFDTSFIVFVEVPVAEDPSMLIAELAARGLRAKIRTGGVTADAFPSPDHVLRFLAACARQGVAFKATAGLHHPLRGEYPLTYDADSARGPMHGFLNVFLAAALLYDGVDASELLPLLEERAAAAIEVDDAALRWRAHVLSIEEISRARAAFAGSFGSCSLEEPVRDLAALHLLPP